MKFISRRSAWLGGAGALLLIVALLTFQFTIGFTHVNAAKGGNGKSQAHLKGAGPSSHNVKRAVNGVLTGDDGGGDTDTTIDPTLSAQCQSQIGNTHVYNNPAPNVDQINGDVTVNVGSQTGCKAAQNETTIAVNSTNPNNLVAGTNDYRVFNTREGRNDGSGWAYSTHDGGATWTNVVLPHLTFQTGATGALSDMDSAGDPAVSFGPGNTVYYANLVFSRLNGGSGFTVSTSHDGGLTWGEPSIVHTDGVDASGNPIDTDIANDKEWIVGDPNSNTVYLTWTEFGPTGSPIFVSKSTDGATTWSAPTQVTPAFTPGGITPFDQGSIPQIGKHGELYIAYEGAVCATLNCDQATDHDAIIMAKSTDGGATFSNTEVAPDFDFPRNRDVGRATLTGENFRINSFPQFVIDGNGRQYVTWADDRNGQYDANGTSIKTNGDVFVATSENGKNWNKVSQIGTSDDEVFPAIAAQGPNVVVTFYTRHFDLTGINLDYAYATATGLGNLSHTSVSRITTQSEDPGVQFVGVGAVSHHILQGLFIGDYTAVAMGSDGKFHPCWTDFRGNPGVTSPNQDAYSQAISFS